MTSSPTCVIGIGAQKAGTSTIARELARHPDFAFSTIKELHYFDSRHIPRFKEYSERIFRKRRRDLLNEARLGAAKKRRLAALDLRLEMEEGKLSYIERFAREFDLSKFKCFGEITPSYGLLPQEGFAEIRDTYPDTKLIFIMRDPVDRALSHARFEVVRGAKTKAQVQGGFFENLKVIERSQYAETIEKVSAVFDRENIFYGFFEDLVADMPGFYRALYAFLDLDYVSPDLSRHVNPSGAIDFDVPEKKIFDRLRPTYELISRNTLGIMPRRWYKRLEQFA